MISFRKKPDAGGDTQTQVTAGLQAEPQKARPWFERARTVADTRNYDYAIECYIAGLQYDPENMDQHDALHEVARRRKVQGGKPAGMIEQFKHSGGKTPVDKMLNAEYLWTKDPLNPSLALSVMEQAVKAGAPEVAYWAGEFVLDTNQMTKKPNKSTYLKVRDLYARIGAYDKAVEACKRAVSLDPQNMGLLADLKDLEAERTMMEGKYGDADGGFQQSVKDMDKQSELAQEDSIAQSDSAKDEMIARARANYEDNPEDLDRLLKLVRALLQKEDEQAESEAIELLKEALDRSGQYRFKVQIGDIKIKQFNRRMRAVNLHLRKNPDDEQAKQLLKKIRQEKLTFELAEFQERVKNYPTDMALRYELGRRQFESGQYDDAIASLQEAQSDPKHRASAMLYLGLAFRAKDWLDEAIDTLKRGIELHEVPDDRVALELRYALMDSQEVKARQDGDVEAAIEAQKVASNLAQTDYNYRDIRQRVERIRELVGELRAKAEPGE